MSFDLSVLQDRRTATAFTAANPTPLNEQLCIETDTGRAKVGDGSTAYAALSYMALSGDERRSADDVYAAQRLSDGRDDTGGGGGGGGIEDGDTLTTGLTFPQNGLKTETPSGDVLSINANGTQTADRTLSIDIGDSDKQVEITDDVVLSGENTGDEHTIITTWRDWATDEILGGPSMPVDLITHYGLQYGANHASGADSGLILVLPMPLKYQGGEMGITLYGTVTGGETGNCAIYCKAQVINTGDGMTGLSADGAIPTPSTLTATGLADGDLWAKDFSINPSGTWAAGSMLAIFFGRNGAAGSDTYPESLYIHSMRITYSGAA